MGDRRADRQQALRDRLHQSGLDALLVSHLPNIRYLTGFRGSAALLLMAPGRTVLLTDSRYGVQAPEEVRGLAEVEVESTDVWQRLRSVARTVAPGRIGFESERLTVRQAERLAGAVSGRPEPTAGLVEGFRVIKDPDEVAALREAVAVAEAAIAAVLPGVRPGDTEAGLAGRLEAELRRRGSEAHPFPVIVASGPRSALPHAGTTRREVRRGDLLLLDFGAQVDGYCADLTRTIVVGPADGRQREVFEAVRRAQAAALGGLRAGLTGREADALARQALVRDGLGEAFGHSLGHGLGLEVHEDPRLARTVGEPLPAGAVVTVEPGAYLEGWGGVRLEDDVVLTSAGADPLSTPVGELVELT